MKVIECIESRERCAEAGWFAYDFIIERPASEEMVRQMRPLGSLTYLGMLKKPFFKIENHYYILKGIVGDDFFRMAVHCDHPEELERIRCFVETQL